MTDKQIKALYIARQLLLDGWTLAGAAGAIANIEAESAFKRTNLQDSYERVVGMTDEQYTNAVDSGYYTNFAGDGCGYGICQWTAHDRKRGMLNYHRARGKSIGDFECQVDWMKLEIRSYKHPYTVCKESNDPYTCGYVFCMEYEIPDNTKAKAEYRGGLAQEWYAWLENNLEPVEDTTQTPTPYKPKDPIEATFPPDPTIYAFQLYMWRNGYWEAEKINGHKSKDFFTALEQFVKDMQTC